MISLDNKILLGFLTVIVLILSYNHSSTQSKIETISSVLLEYKKSINSINKRTRTLDRPTLKELPIAEKFVMYDLGAHNGDSIGKMIEPSKHQNSNLGKYIKDWIFRSTPMTHQLEVVYSFEGNPLMFPTIVDKVIQYPKMSERGFPVLIYPILALACDRYGPANIYLDNPNDNNNEGGTMNEPKEKLNVKVLNTSCIDIGKFILATSKPEDFVFMKVDVNGGEFEILDHLVRSGACRNIDRLNILYYGHKLATSNYPQKILGTAQHTLTTELQKCGCVIGDDTN